jgi:hypothetical protein
VRLVVGDDWAEDHHDVKVLDALAQDLAHSPQTPLRLFGAPSIEMFNIFCIHTRKAECGMRECAGGSGQSRAGHLVWLVGARVRCRRGAG